MELRPFKQRAFHNVDDRISGLILEDKGTSDRVFVSDWSGKLQILKFEKEAGPDPKVLRTYQKEDSSASILSIDRNKSTSGPRNEQILIGGSDGHLDCYHADINKTTNISEDNAGRPISKVISVEDSTRIFSFSWDKTMHIWDSRDKDLKYFQNLPENFITAEYLHPYIVLVLGNNSIAFISVEKYNNGEAIKPKLIGNDELVRSIALSDSLKHIAIGDVTGTIKIMEKEDSVDLNSYSVKGSLLDDGYPCQFKVEAHNLKTENSKYNKVLFPVNAIDFRPKTNVLFSAGGDGYVRAINYEDEVVTKQNIFKVKGNAQNFQNPITHLKFHNDGTSLLVAETQEVCYNLFDENFSDKPNSTIRMLQLIDLD